MSVPTLEHIVLEHDHFIRQTLSQLGVPGRDLDDVEQAVLCGIDRGLASFDPSLARGTGAALRGWIFGICARQAANHRRAARRRAEDLTPVEEICSIPAVQPDAEEGLLSAERRALLFRLLDTLVPERRAIVVAYGLQGTPMGEVAASLGIPVNTAWDRLRRARADLQAAWKRALAGTTHVLSAGRAPPSRCDHRGFDLAGACCRPSP